jgi:hypothetical protein
VRVHLHFLINYFLLELPIMSEMGSNMESGLFLSESSKDGEWQTVYKGKHTQKQTIKGSLGTDKAPKSTPITYTKKIRANQKETKFSAKCGMRKFGR